jgi:RNA polymerase sigma factor (sigma-70 family)
VVLLPAVPWHDAEPAMKPDDPNQAGKPKKAEPETVNATEFLVHEAVHGEAGKAWEQLSEKILYYLRTRFGNASFPRGVEFHDFVSDAMVKILTSIDTFEYRGKDSFWKWVQTLAGNLWRDFWRRNERDRKLGLLGRGDAMRGEEDRPPSVTEAAPAKGETPTQAVRLRELAKAESEAIEKLPQHMRDPYVLRRQLDLSFAEISERLGGLNEATLRSNYMRARDKIRESLGKKLDEIGTKIQGW